MTRRQIRGQIFSLLFSAEFFTGDEKQAQLASDIERLRLSGEVKDEEDMDYIGSKTMDICAHLSEIDDRVNACAVGWKTSRMAKAELAIIRLAVYEMFYEEEIPVTVAINEAVELAKVYGSDKSPAFVNGVLAKLV